MSFILVGVVIFLTIPKPGKSNFLYVGLLLIVCLLTELISFIGAHALHTNMNWSINIFVLLNFPLILLIYKDRIHWQGIKKIAYAMIIAFALFELINMFLIQGIYAVNTYSVSITGVCVIVISLLYFYVLIQQLPTESITKLPMFWINTAMLIYWSGTFLFFLSADYLITVMKNNMITFLFIHHLVALIYYPMLAYSLWLVRLEAVASPATISK